MTFSKDLNRSLVRLSFNSDRKTENSHHGLSVHEIDQHYWYLIRIGAQLRENIPEERHSSRTDSIPL